MHDSSEIIELVYKNVGDILRKGEKSGDQDFPLFPQFYKKVYFLAP